MASYLEQRPAPRDNGFLRPLEPRRSRGPPSPNQGRGRVSTGTWVSSSQFQRGPPPEPTDMPSPVPTARGLQEPYSNGPAPGGYDDAHYYAPHEDAEHMTVQVEQRQSYANEEAAYRKRGSSVGGFLRRITGMERRESQPMPPDFAPGIVPAPSYARNVTYVDTTEMPEDEDYPPTSRHPDHARNRGEGEYSEPIILPAGSHVDDLRDFHDAHDTYDPRDPHHPYDPRDTHDPYDPRDTHDPRESHEGTVVDADPAVQDIDGTTAVHHGPPFMPPRDMQSPVYREPRPTSDYDKMSAFHTAPSELHSLTSYIDRVQQFLHDLYDLPWTSARVAADYVPGESSRSQYYRFKQRHPNNGGAPLNSWYKQPTRHELDLLASPPGMRETGPPLASLGPNYTHPGSYPQPLQGGNGFEYTPRTEGADEVRSQYSSLPEPSRPFATPSITWDPQVRSHSRPLSPPRTTSPSAQTLSPGRSFASPRADYSSATLPQYGQSSTIQSPRTDATIHTASHTASVTVRGSDRERGTVGGTAGSDTMGSPRSRHSWYSSAKSTPIARTATLPPDALPPGTVRSDGGRSARSGGNSSGRAPAVPVDGTMPVYLVPVTPPASPPRTQPAAASSRRNRYDHYTQPFVVGA